MRFIYRYYGRKIPKMNFFGNTKKIPDSWYSDDIKITDVEIIDPLFMKTWNYGYLNHIERLMVMGNFCLYNGFHPKDVYEWFMICFIDSYDWVMYTNVYGMSQYAFTDLSITSRPYICSSSYILKMSSYKKGDWVDQWDELLYEFVGKHEDKLKKLYRMYVFINMWKKWKKNNI
jgi:deoxyribodipyrimidine photolyase-related protein